MKKLHLYAMRDHLSPLKITLGFLTFVWFILVWQNFPRHGFFSSWDNLHPEFDIVLNLKRQLFGVWQEHQGVGHVGGHGYAAALPHTLSIGVLSLLLPIHYLRSTFTFLTLLVGAYGSFFLIAYVLKLQKPSLRYPLALIGALFYMLNFATVQQYYIQLEAFIIHFAALPWLILLTLQLLERWSKKTFIIFLFASFAGSSQGFIPPLFIAYVLLTGFILAMYVLFERNILSIKKSTLLLFSIFCINAYWLLPLAYYTVNDSHVFLNSYNNLLSTQSWIDTNNSFGTLSDLATLKGFPSLALDFVEDQGNINIFAPWITHLSRPLIKNLGYGLFILITVGLLGFAIQNFKNKKYEFGIALFALLIFSALAADVPVLSYVSDFIQKLPLFRQAFRTGFTKLSISLSLTYALFLSFGIYYLMQILSRVNKKVFKLKSDNKTFVIQVGCLISGFAILAFSFPAFTGNFLYPKARLNIPDAYFELFSYLNTQPADSRMMTLPQGDHWGWEMNRWGYTGSGFFWFGVPQATTERAFDVWSNYNENLYWELSQALFSKNYVQFEQLLDKYQIDWIVFDDSFISYPQSKSVVYANDLRDYLKSTPALNLVKQYPLNEGGFSSLYLFEHTSLSTDRISLKSLPTIGPSTNWNNSDQAYHDLGDYQTPLSSQATTTYDYFYPFASLFTGRRQEELEFAITEEARFFVLEQILPKSLQQQQLVLPALTLNDPDQEATSSSPRIFIDNNLLYDYRNNAGGDEISLTLPAFEEGKLQIIIPKQQKYSSHTDPYFADPTQPCDAYRTEFYGSEVVTDQLGQSIHYFDNRNSASCKDIYIDSLFHRYGYLASVKSKYFEGNSLTMYLINSASLRYDVTSPLPKEESLITSYFVLPPMEYDTRGYSFRFSNSSIGSNHSINELHGLEVHQIPYEYLKSIRVQKTAETFDQASVWQINGVSHTNSALYTVTLNSVVENPTPATLTLGQGYHKDWWALVKTDRLPYFKKLNEHVMVNNWANGWNIKSSDYKPQTSDSLTTNDPGLMTIYILFWPQILQFLGFGLGGLVIVLFILLQTSSLRAEGEAILN